MTMTHYDPEKHHRRSIRLKNYDYSQAGAYFVTICIQGRQCFLGEIRDSIMQVNVLGDLATTAWQNIPEHFPNVSLDAFVLMPNHMHGILVIHDDRYLCRGGVSPPNVEARPPWPDMDAATQSQPRKPTLGQIVGYYKYQATKLMNHYRNTPGSRIWQRNYYEHIIRSEESLQQLRAYIVNNPRKWERDQLHPNNPSKW